MINREEMLEFAREFQLEPNVVETDYALSGGSPGEPKDR